MIAPLAQGRCAALRMHAPWARGKFRLAFGAGWRGLGDFGGVYRRGRRGRGGPQSWSGVWHFASGEEYHGFRGAGDYRAVAHIGSAADPTVPAVDHTLYGGRGLPNFRYTNSSVSHSTVSPHVFASLAKERAVAASVK
jgi:hypothetical protein